MKEINQNRIVIKAVGFGVTAGTIVILLFLLLFSLLMVKQDIPLAEINPIVVGVLIIGTFVSAFITSKIIKKKGYLLGMIVASCLYVIVLLFSMVVLGEGFSIASLFKLVMMILSGAIGGIFAANAKTLV